MPAATKSCAANRVVFYVKQTTVDDQSPQRRSRVEAEAQRRTTGTAPARRALRRRGRDVMAAELHHASSSPSQAELIALLDGIATSIVWLDADGAVVHLNEPAEDMFGISRNQAAGRSMRDLLKIQHRTRRRDQPRARRGRAVFASRDSIRGGTGRTTARARRDGDAVRSAGTLGRRDGRTRRHDSSPAHHARKRAADAARRQPRDGSAARARDQESARRPARARRNCSNGSSRTSRCTNTRP